MGKKVHCIEFWSLVCFFETKISCIMSWFMTGVELIVFIVTGMGLCSWVLFFVLNCLCLKPRVLWLLPFQFSSQSHWCGTWLLGVEPPHIALCYCFLKMELLMTLIVLCFMYLLLRECFFFFKINFSRLNETHCLNRLIICGLRKF